MNEMATARREVRALCALTANPVDDSIATPAVQATHRCRFARSVPPGSLPQGIVFNM